MGPVCRATTAPSIEPVESWRPGSTRGGRLATPPLSSSPARGANHPHHIKPRKCLFLLELMFYDHRIFYWLVMTIWLAPLVCLTEWWPKCNSEPRMRWPSYLIMASYSREAAKFVLLVIFGNRRKDFKHHCTATPQKCMAATATPCLDTILKFYVFFYWVAI